MNQPTKPRPAPEQNAHLQRDAMRGIATRKSQLALWQAQESKRLLESLRFACKIVPTETTGDRIQSSPLALNELPHDHPAQRHVSTGKGLFIKEVQDLLLEGHCHLAVHSMKDLPVAQTEKLTLAGFLRAASASDVLVLSPALLARLQDAGTALPRRSSPEFLAQLQELARPLPPIGTTSARRQALLIKCGLSELPVVMLRGNVDTRLRRLRNNEFSAIVLAEAGLCRLGLFDASFMVELDPEEFVPACTQGVVGLETLAADVCLSQALLQHSNKETLVRVALERLTLFLLGGSCQSAIGIHFDQSELKVFTAQVPVSSHTPGRTSALNLGQKLGQGSAEQGRAAHPCATLFQDWKGRMESAWQAGQIKSFQEIFEDLKQEKRFVDALYAWLAAAGHTHG